MQQSEERVRIGSLEGRTIELHVMGQGSHGFGFKTVGTVKNVVGTRMRTWVGDFGCDPDFMVRRDESSAGTVYNMYLSEVIDGVIA